MWKISVVLLSVLITTSAHLQIIELPLVSEQSYIYNVVDSAIKLIVLNDFEVDTKYLFTNTIRTLSEIEIGEEYDPFINVFKLLVKEGTLIERRWFDLEHNLNLIHTLYKSHYEYSYNKTSIPFVHPIQSVLENINRIIIGKTKRLNDKTLLEILHRNGKNFYMKNKQLLCEHGLSLQSLFYRLYKVILKSEAQGFITVANTFLHNSYFEYSMGKTVIVKLASEYLTKTKQYIQVFKKIMSQIETMYDLCDPPHQKRNKNYFELEGAIQKTIVHEIALVENYVYECIETCGSSSYNTTPKLLTHCESNKANYNNWCPIRPCRGIVSECFSASHIKFGEMSRGFSRRYTSIIMADSIRYGNDTSTEVINMKPYSISRKADSYTSGFVSCDMCICTCTENDEYPEVIRTISLRPVLSNIKENMVVTGLRFTLADGVVQIQIQESKLLPYGRVLKNHSHWLPYERFHRKNDGTMVLQSKSEQKILIKEIDYTYITPNHKTINLDDIVTDDNYVVTGVKIGKIENLYKISRMQLEVHTTKLDFLNGSLSQRADDSIWRFINNDNVNRSRLQFSRPDSPLNINTNHNKYSAKNKYVVFDTSDLIKDAGQTTIPLFDAQSAVLNDDQPLSGVGLIHRGASGSGGFLAFRLFALKLYNYWEV